MKLSKALKAGRKIVPVGHTGSYFSRLNPKKACVMGACFVGALGRAPEPDEITEIGVAAEFEDAAQKAIGVNVYEDVARHPVINRTYSIFDILSSLNDAWHWDDEAVIKWLESEDL